MINRMAAIMVCLVLAFSLVSCDDQGKAVGYGSLSVEVSNGDGSKTIRPTDESLAFASYRVEGRHRTIEGRTVDETFTDERIEIDFLETGDWEFMVEGLNKDKVVLAKSDTHIVTIKTNGTAKETYTLDWIEGHGTLRLSVKVQTSRVSTMECKLYDEDGNEAGTYAMTKADSQLDDDGFLVFEHSFTDVATGSYDATMTMKDKDGGMIGRALHPSVHIHDGLVSSYGFSWENFRNLLPNVDAPKVTNIGDGSTAVSCDYSILIGTEENGTTIFYSLDGKKYSEYQEGVIDLSAMRSLSDSIAIWTYAEKANLNKSDVAEYTFNIEHNSPDRANAEYTWNKVEGGYECIATSKCKYHKSVECETEKAVVSYQVITDFTCSKEGVGRYTAEFAKEGYKVQTMDEAIARKHIYDREVAEDKYLKSSATCLESAVYYKSCECGRPSSEEYFSFGDPLGHDLVHHEAKAATCTGIGWDEYDTCSRCSYTTYEEIPALGHDKIHHEAKDPTCTEIGWSVYDTCTRCGYTTYKEIEALGHDKVHHEAKAATCTEIGWDEYDTCTRCGYTTYKAIPALGHDLVHHDEKEPTCTEIGWDAYDECTRGDYTAKVEKSVLGHDYVKTETKAPTCTETGMYEHVCSRCGDTKYETILALGHKFEHHDAKDPTCTAIGWSSYDTCTRCEYTTYKEIKALGHDLVHHEAKKPTCTEDGWDAYDECSRGDYTAKVEKSALGHDYVKTETKAPTCTDAGMYEHVCSRCSHTKYETIPKLGHELEHHEAKNPTCTKIGWYAYDTCTRCEYTTYEEIKALGHDKVHHEANGATCTEIGWNEYDTCTRCDYTTYEEINALGHDLVHHEAKNPTCTDVGWGAYDECSRGDYTTKAEKSALGHDYVKTETETPTCTEIGMYECVCSRCSQIIHEEIPAFGHNVGSFRCFNDEYHSLICSRCSTSIDKKLHSFKDYKCTECGTWGRGPSGGYVFYDRGEYTGGEHSWRYLEAAPADLRLVSGVPTVDSSMAGYADGEMYFVFGYYRETSDGSNVYLDTKNEIGEGYNNTGILVRNMKEVSYGSSTGTTSNYAARLCDVLVYEVNGKELKDWFLPSKYELNLLYKNLREKGLGSFAYNYYPVYWSRSENDADNAWLQAFATCSMSSGDQYSLNRDYELRVRPVRAF